MDLINEDGSFEKAAYFNDCLYAIVNSNLCLKSEKSQIAKGNK